MEFKNIKEMFQYLMNGYKYELKAVETKKGKQRRLENEEIENIIDTQLQEKIKIEDLYVKVKLGPAYNRKEIPWIQIYSIENIKGTTGRYIGISFNAEEQMLETWIGFGSSKKKQPQIISEAKDYIRKYMLLEKNLKHGYYYNDNTREAFIIKKHEQLRDLNDKEFMESLNYLADLYKKYESKYELAVFKEKEESSSNINLDSEKNINLDKQELLKINQTMLYLVEQIGNLAKEIKELNSKL